MAEDQWRRDANPIDLGEALDRRQESRTEPQFADCRHHRQHWYLGWGGMTRRVSAVVQRQGANGFASSVGKIGDEGVESPRLRQGKKQNSRLASPGSQLSRECSCICGLRPACLGTRRTSSHRNATRSRLRYPRILTLLPRLRVPLLTLPLVLQDAR
jgi:hypothetical protein